jgi:uncharacterized cupredoxin-like copper-binding protein
VWRHRQSIRGRRRRAAHDPDFRERVLAHPVHRPHAKTGTYELEATNNGTIAHALELDGHGVQTGDIQPGATATLPVTLAKDGSYPLYCPIDGPTGLRA